MKTGWTFILVVLTACSSPASDTSAAPKEAVSKAGATTNAAETPAPAVSNAVLTLSPTGLLVGGKLVPFGIPRESAELAINHVEGRQKDTGSSDECSAGKIDYTSYKDDLQLTFQDDKFVGWTINRAASPLRTAKGIGVGSPRQSLDAAYKYVLVEDSSLGLLFGADGLTGLLDQDGIEGIVTNIWAGTVCLID